MNANYFLKSLKKNDTFQTTLSLTQTRDLCPNVSWHTSKILFPSKDLSAQKNRWLLTSTGQAMDAIMSTSMQ